MAIGTPVGSAFLEVQPQLGTGFQAAIAGKLSPIMTGVAAAAGGLLAGGIAAGFAAFKIGETFDTAFDEIRIGTGATGEELAGLQEDFKAVFGSVPTDAGLASQAITELNQRLGITGGQLQGTAQQFLELSRITETDLGANIESVTRVFGDWGITLDDQGERLDQLFRANQRTGIGIDQLAQSLVKFGAPLRQLGFSFDQSAALISKFEQEGVNTELVLGSMRIALGKMARAGEPAQETFQRVTEEIKNAGSASEANALALELFGARAGPDMAAAIREGRFEIEALYQEIGFGSDTIEKASGDTQDFAEKWEMFKNRVLVALEPIATRVFDSIGTLIDKIGPPIEKWIVGTLVPAIERFSAWFDENGPRIMAVAQEVFGVIGTAIGNVVGFVKEILATFQANEAGLTTSVANIGSVLKGLGETITVIFTAIRDFWARWGDEITELLFNAINTISGIIKGVLDVIKGVFEVFAGVFTGDWKRVWEGLKSIFKGIWNTIASLIQGALTQLRIFFGEWIDDTRESIGRGVNQIVKFFQELPGRILNWLKELPGQMVEFGKSLVDGILRGIGNLGTQLFNKLKESIGNAIQNAKEFFGISSPSKFTAKIIGFPLGQGVTTGFEAGVDPDAMLATTQNAIGAIAGAAGPTLGLRATGTDGQGFIDSAPAMPTTVVISLDPEGRERFVEMVIDWQNKRVRQVNRAGG